MRIVIDASVAMTWFLSAVTEPHVKQARALRTAVFSGALEAVAPPHWLAEVMAVLARKEPSRIADAFDVIYGLDIPVISDRQVHESAARLAVALDHHLFDTLYHAVALEMDATLVTADIAYFRKARRLGHIQQLAGFRAARP